MENCTIYSHKFDFSIIENLVQKHLPKADIKLNDGGLQKQMIITSKGGFLSKSKVLKISYRQRAEPSYNLEAVNCGLSQNLAGMMNFVNGFPTQDENLKALLMQKIASCNSEIPFITESGWTDVYQALLKDIVQSMDAIVFAQPNGFFTKSRSNHFTDSQLNLILDQEGQSEVSTLDVKIDASLFEQKQNLTQTDASEAQLSRKKRSEDLLQLKGVKVNANLPSLPEVSDVELRSPEAVSERIHALLLAAAKADGLELEQFNKIVEGKKITFSPQESDLVSKINLTDSEKANALWRYESVAVLMWAAGLVDTLDWPSDICDIKILINKVMSQSRTDFEAQIKMRSKEEIMDRLDAIYRMNWASVDARINGKELGGALNPSVIYERHYAFNWLTQYRGQEWDQVSTDT